MRLGTHQVRKWYVMYVQRAFYSNMSVDVADGKEKVMEAAASMIGHPVTGV